MFCQQKKLTESNTIHDFKTKSSAKWNRRELLQVDKEHVQKKAKVTSYLSFPGGSVVKNPPAKQEMKFQFSGQEGPL